MPEIYDLIIVGSGPAGLSAAIYGVRAKLNLLVIEKEMMSGGQIINTYEVDNYPGLMGINGFDMAVKFREHAEKLGAVFAEETVTGIGREENGLFQVRCAHQTYETKTVIIASGAHHSLLNVPGETELGGKGVSYCATCDGAFYKNKVTAVVGGGDVALEDAIFLSRLCRKVYIIHRRNEFRGAKILQETLLSTENIEPVWDSIVDRINGTDAVSSLSVRNVRTGGQKELEVNGVFIAVGIVPDAEGFDLVSRDEKGYIVAGEDGRTSVPGIFAAGDVRTKGLRQIVTAVSDGANAVTSVEKFLTEKR
jgi:thioredoxin reductase (NADPH)